MYLPQFAEVMCKNAILSKDAAGVEPNTLIESCTFKGKCVVNAEIFICNFLTGPLIKTIFEGRHTILEERAFQQCIKVSFCETVPLKQDMHDITKSIGYWAHAG